MTDDKTLMYRFKCGDDESFETLVLRHRKSAISFAIRYISDAFLAEDIVQESFADIYVYKERYNDTYSFKTYLYTIIRYKAIDQLRKLKNYCYEDNFEAYNEQSPEISVLEQEKSKLLLSNINCLKQEYRIVIYLSQIDGLKQKDIAKIMGKNIGQIKILNFRAKKKLKQLVEKEVL